VSALLHYWEAGGPLMIPMAALCFATWYWLLTLGSRLRREGAAARGVQELLHGKQAGGVPEAVANWARAHPGPVARVARYATGGGIVRDAIRYRSAEARMVELPRFERELTILKAMVAAAPLLGLLGTVRGMISTFSVLSLRGTASIELLSSGISEAFVTTQAGLVVALPGLVGAYLIGRRLAGLEVSLDILESHLLAVTANSAPARAGGSP
jgi:biopolymer transport protein ExbB